MDEVVTLRSDVIVAWLSWAVPGLYLLGALLASTSRNYTWSILAMATRGALAIAVLAGSALLWHRGMQGFCVQLSAPPLVSVLVTLLGWIIGDYSRRYLEGEPGQSRYVISYLATLASVSIVIWSPNFALVIAAWAASSAGVHQLLTFYPARPAALVVAHKKFLASRLAEACLIVAAVLLYRTWGTLQMSELARHATAVSALPATAQVAASLIALAALLKCAQLPLHGWLIQVMEAPTPVSALLHAGVVNLGGYVLIRLAPLISGSLSAQTLLVVIGGLTAVLAGLVTLTRVTIKVRLAWSTCSQMGLMMLECGLGLYSLALLHLLAHSLYKAHAFLTAGETVANSLRRAMMVSDALGASRVDLRRRLIALPLAYLVIEASASLWHNVVALPRVPWIASIFLACGLATLLWSATSTRRSWLPRCVALLCLAQLSLGWHWLTSDPSALTRPPSAALTAWAFTCAVGLYAALVWLAHNPSSAAVATAHRWVYAGFYLDERFTRLTFRLWPVRTRPQRSGGFTERVLLQGASADE
ncbi:MAG: NADH-quinone oxidoreductase subunit L [Proteobacteria bacterium]|nr:NADH-quinone oxidoreductase subunit L [Pseudomonadota bacterium]